MQRGLKERDTKSMHSSYADLSTASAMMLMSVSLYNGEVVALNTSFLLAHPSLHDVSINLQGQPLQDTALPKLRSFSPIDCVTICNGTRRIESLKLLLLEPKFDLSLRGARKQSGVGSWGIGSWGDEYVWDEDTVLQRLAKTPTLLRRLHLTTGILHPDESPQFEEQGLHNDHIKKIAKSCPYLTHLELHVWDQ